jgi:fructosamine-3-kinase
MTLPAALAAVLTAQLNATLEDIRPVGGGDISQAARVAAGGRMYLVKWHARPPQPMPGWLEMFEAEAAGLALLAAAQAVRIPTVVAHGAAQPGVAPAYIAMEWIDRGREQRSAGETLGRQLAELHRMTAPAYGLDHGNYCGATPQDNRTLPMWVEFYGVRRLGFQMELAGRQGLLPKERRRRLEHLIGNLSRWIDESACRRPRGRAGDVPAVRRLSGRFLGGLRRIVAACARPRRTYPTIPTLPPAEPPEPFR